DHTIANIEVQKIGYKFAGERASCYSADLLLRQYKRLKDQAKEHFSYKDIAPVYTIVFFENSFSSFNDYPDTYIHRFSTTSDTGIHLNMLQNYIFIPIDIFLQKLHNENEGINCELDAWLTFLGCDEPEYIIKLIEKYPYFRTLYEDLYDICLNVERVINMYSKELAELDRNTVKYMIDELQEELDSANEELANKDATIAKKDAAIADKDAAIADKDATIADKDATIKALQDEIERLKCKK
ncbi:PD-(D/E)XK nuclease family transposase, partial [Butyrivibrio sp. YAB3001]|uniref:PD-(D/E)XK nuclease family transposase n=1 Tax=Butyrivibrio sp. YAB3001 TaxID=1520812 RepID=UPI0008F655F2